MSQTTPRRIQIVVGRPSISPWLSIYHNSYSPRGTIYVDTSPRVARSTFSLGDAVLLTGVGGLITYGFVKGNTRQNHQSFDEMSIGPLGPGATSASVTVSINIPDRNDPNNILNRLKSLAERVDTSTRQGIQELIAESSIELLRNEALITSMLVKSKHHSDPEAARRDFNAQSVENRSKYDREAVDRFGGRYVSHTASSNNSPSSQQTRATVAVITLNLAIDGDSTHVPNVKSREKLVEALRRIASDARVEDCLFAAEVIWIPGDRDENLTRDDVYELYPNLLLA